MIYEIIMTIKFKLKLSKQNKTFNEYFISSLTVFIMALQCIFVYV